MYILNLCLLSVLYIYYYCPVRFIKAVVRVIVYMCMKKGGYMCMYDRQLPFNILIIIAMQQSHITCFSIPLLLCLLSLCCNHARVI